MMFMHAALTASFHLEFPLSRCSEVDKNHSRARHSWIQIEVQIGPSVIKQWAFPLGHVGTAAVRLCGWSPLQRCKMEIRFEAKLHSKRVPRKAVNTATPSPPAPAAAKHTYYMRTFSGVHTPPDRWGKEEWFESQWRRLRVLKWTLLTDCRCSSVFGPSWLNMFLLVMVPTPCIETLKDVLKLVKMCYLFQTWCWWDGLLFKHLQAFIPSMLFSSFLFLMLQLGSLAQGSYPFTHLSRPDILSRF